jgi:hypothetical protein
MKTSALVLAAVIAGAARLTAAPGGAKDPETVVVTFHVREGKETDMEKLLREDHWPLLRRLGLVYESPHVLVRGKEAGDKPYFKEVLTWRDHETPDNAPPEVQDVWKRMNEFVEKRGGAPGIEIDEVDLMIPSP